MTAAVAAILQESNAFSPVKARYEGFCPVLGLTAPTHHRGKPAEMGCFIDMLWAARIRIGRLKRKGAHVSRALGESGPGNL